MEKLYGEALKESILARKARIQRSIDDRANRIAEGWTDEEDCFISSRTDRQSLAECDMQLEILAGDGLMDFDAIFDEDGKEVNVKWVHTKYGGAYVGRGIFASSKKALCKKTGWHVEEIRVPVWTSFHAGSGGGFLGAYTGSYQYVRWHTNMVTGEPVGFPE